jgi:NAD+ kinase
MQRIGIFAKKNQPDAIALALKIEGWLRDRGLKIFCEEELAAKMGVPGSPAAEIPALCDMLIVLGGDGTLISVAREIGKLEKPILGVNLGSLGFLTEITTQSLFPVLEKILAGDYETSDRLMLDVVVCRNNQPFVQFQVLNDVVINKGALARIIDMKAWVNDIYLTTYKADGLIISSPTGSTAYNMAAGGPIIYPGSACLVITPICPHMLTNRPMIISSDAVIRVEVLCHDEDVVLTADGQVGIALMAGDIVEVRQAANCTRLILSPEKDYFEVLRTKLRWGER